MRGLEETNNNHHPHRPPASHHCHYQSQQSTVLIMIFFHCSMEVIFRFSSLFFYCSSFKYNGCHDKIRDLCICNKKKSNWEFYLFFTLHYFFGTFYSFCKTCVIFKICLTHISAWQNNFILLQVWNYQTKKI